MQAVEKTPLFQHLSPERVAELLQHRGQVRHFSAGETVYDPQHFQRAMGIVLQGRLKVTTETEVVLTILHSGSLFGVAGLFLERDDYVTRIQAIKPSEVLFLTTDDLEAIFKEEYSVCLQYLRFLSQRIVFLNQRISQFVAPSPAEALYAFLTRLAIAAETDRFHLPMSKQEMCRQMNMGRTTLYRAWDQLLTEGRLIEHSDTSLQVILGGTHL